MVHCYGRIPFLKESAWQQCNVNEKGDYMSVCECTRETIAIPVRGLTLNLDSEFFPASSSGGQMDYSSEEQDTGCHWIDGKKIYRKTIACGQLPNKSLKQVPHRIFNIENCIRIYGFANRKGYKNPLPFVSPTGVHLSLYLIDNDFIALHAAGDHSAYKESYITIEYTCVDR